MRRLLLLPALAAGLAVAGCGLDDDGPRTSQTRDVASFTRIDNQDSVDVRVHVGERPQRVRVSAGRKVIDDVRTEVRDGALRVSFSHHGWGGGSVEVEAWVPALTAISTDGSGDVSADGIAADAFQARSDGSGDLRATGRAARLTVELDGSGDAHLADFAAKDAKVTVGGSGDLDVRAGDRLDASVDGSGDVRYRGNPVLTRHVDGAGDITRAD
jgi:hypothetical protein